MTPLNYNHLRYFWAVAHDGNLTRTAERLNLTQSALSVQIRKLEQRLGHPLFERRGRQLHLTEAGQIVLDHADAIFATGDELLGTLRQSGVVRQALRVGSLATLSRNFQMEFLRPVLGRADIDLILRSGSAGELLRALEALSLDVVLLNRFAHLTGWGWEADDDRVAALAALDRFGLSALAERDVRSLSGGERQRVALAAVFCQDAPLLLLDEPLAHLDWHRQIACLEALVAWSEEAPRIVVFSCHDLNLARRYATHALLLDGVGGVAAGPAREVLTPGGASAAFGAPLVLIERDGYEALVPALPPPPQGSGPGPAKDT